MENARQWQPFDESQVAVSIWVIYDHPKDFPDGYVARRHVVLRGGEQAATNEAYTCAEAEPLRQSLSEHGLVKMARHPSDDPVIAETWI